MKSILDDLFEGRIYPHEQLVPNHPEYLEAVRRSGAIMNELQGMLNSEGKMILKELDTLTTVTLMHSSREYFCGGFKLGARIFSEALEKGET